MFYYELSDIQSGFYCRVKDYINIYRTEFIMVRKFVKYFITISVN
jgi:hypothetical protein